MTVACVRLPPDLAERFDQVAASEGGRGHVLRRLVDRYLEEAGEGELVERVALQARGRSEKLTLRLRPDDLAQLEGVSRAAGFTRTGWLTGLARSHLFNRPALNPVDAEAYRLAGQELNRIGRNINQITRVMNTAAQGEVVLQADLRMIDEARAEIRAIALALRDALHGNLSYWAGS